jgi:hypothetical protein
MLSFIIRFVALAGLAAVVVFFHNPIVLGIWIVSAGLIGSSLFRAEGNRLRRFLAGRRQKRQRSDRDSPG